LADGSFSVAFSVCEGKVKHSMAQALRSTRVLTADGLTPATLVLEGEKIAAIRAWSDAGNSVQLQDFDDLVLLPGLVDSHVHINDPGRNWEGFETATRAAAAGGVTTLIDMPLNCVPETTNVAALEASAGPLAATSGLTGRHGEEWCAAMLLSCPRWLRQAYPDSSAS
jgi:dihydroorotase-like cyclic amidohydrolase